MIFLDYAFPWLFALSMVLLLFVTISYSSLPNDKKAGKKAIFTAWALGTFNTFVFSIDEGFLSTIHAQILFLMILGTLGSIALICLSFGYKKIAA
jgi:hypothetical protein